MSHMLKTGNVAPDFKLPFFDGGEASLYSSRKPALIPFYKFSCPVCQFTFPFLQTLYENYGEAISFVAIAQDPSDKVIGFRDAYGITIPIVMDLPPYPVSNAYRIDIVPSVFLVNETGKIDHSFAGFDKRQMENCAQWLAEKSGRARINLFAGISVPELRPG